jgi:hypothetical protein
MGALGFFFAVVACTIIIKLSNWWDNRKEEKETQRMITLNQDAVARQIMNDTFENSNNAMEQTKGTRDLFLETLLKIGCQYELGEGEEDDDKIYFAYQGENFTASASNDGWYVHLWDTHWGHVELYDVDEFSRLRKAINLSNLNCATTTVYTINEVGNNVDVHCKAVIPFISQIPEIENYLRGELNDFFRAHQFVGNQMVKLREKEESIK